MSGVISSNLKEKRRLYLKSFSSGPKRGIHTHTQRETHTHTHTHTHDDGIRRNAMRCISPKKLVNGERCLQTPSMTLVYIGNRVNQ